MLADSIKRAFACIKALRERANESEIRIKGLEMDLEKVTSDFKWLEGYHQPVLNDLQTVFNNVDKNEDAIQKNRELMDSDILRIEKNIGALYDSDAMESERLDKLVRHMDRLAAATEQVYRKHLAYKESSEHEARYMQHRINVLASCVYQLTQKVG